MRRAVVGGGLLGATVALRLAERGEQVTLLEGAPALGGLAAAWTLGNGPGAVTWDRHYHVTLLSDTHTRALYDDLGLTDQVVWGAGKAGLLADGRLVPFSSPADYARLSVLGPVAKARIGLTVLAGALRRDGRSLEAVPVQDWLRRWSGEQATQAFWLPLLRAKLGSNADLASASFLHATIHRLFKARRAGVTADLFGVVRGGYATTLAALDARLRAAGVEVLLGARVTAVRAASGARVEVAVAGNEVAGAAQTTYDAAVVTTAAPIAARLVEGLSPAEMRRLTGVTYQGIVCASLLLRRPLSPYYLTYITDPAPFTAVVEMTALVDRAQTGGHTLVYLPRYVPSDDPWLAKDDDAVRGEFLPALQAIHPSLAASDVLAFAVSRVPFVMPVPTLGYSDRLPPVRTSVPGVALLSSAHLVNATLNVDETLALVERLLPEVLG